MKQHVLRRPPKWCAPIESSLRTSSTSRSRNWSATGPSTISTNTSRRMSCARFRKVTSGSPASPWPMSWVDHSALRDPIANARFGQHYFRIVRMLFNFLPKLADVNAQVLRIFGMRRTPHRGQNLLVSHHASRVFRQERQQLEFFWRELEFCAASRRAVAYGVDFQIADP